MGSSGADFINIAGLPNYSNADLASIKNNFPDGAVSFYVNLASDYPLKKAVSVKVGINTQALSDYNADTINHVITDF